MTRPQIEIGTVEPLHLMAADDPRRQQALVLLKMLPKDATRRAFELMLERVPGLCARRTTEAVMRAKCMSVGEAVQWIEKHHA